MLFFVDVSILELITHCELILWANFFTIVLSWVNHVTGESKPANYV